MPQIHYSKMHCTTEDHIHLLFLISLTALNLEHYRQVNWWHCNSHFRIIALSQFKRKETYDQRWCMKNQGLSADTD